MRPRLSFLEVKRVILLVVGAATAANDVHGPAALDGDAESALVEDVLARLEHNVDLLGLECDLYTFMILIFIGSTAISNLKVNWSMFEYSYYN